MATRIQAHGNLPVVFLHGIRVSGTMWRPAADRVGRRRPVETPDLPGHGRRRHEPFTIDGAVQAVLDAIDDGNPSRPDHRALLVGLSLGGYLALITAGRHPDRVAGVVAMGCSTRTRGLAARLYSTLARRIVSSPGTADRLSAWSFRRLLPPEGAEAALAGGLDCAVVPPVVDALGEVDVLTCLSGYPGPVWLVNGGLDPFRAGEKAFLRACHDGRLQVWPGLNHLTVLRDPDRLVRLVEDACAVAVLPTEALRRHALDQCSPVDGR